VTALAKNGATGYFGALTKNALAEYQAATGIKPASGYFGTLTRASIRALNGT
jgi:peptidoglycan hydrolase-like protein with peptidoglycan-binding domain